MPMATAKDYISYPTNPLGKSDPTVPAVPTVNALLPHMAVPLSSVLSPGANFSRIFFFATWAEEAGSLR
jgi:hypothetical protein